MVVLVIIIIKDKLINLVENASYGWLHYVAVGPE